MRLEVLKKVAGDEEHVARKDTLQNLTARSQLYMDRHQNIIEVKEGQTVPDDYVPVPNTLALDSQQLVEQSSIYGTQPNVVLPGVAITTQPASELPPANTIVPQKYQPYPAVDPLRLSRANMSASQMTKIAGNGGPAAGLALTITNPVVQDARVVGEQVFALADQNTQVGLTRVGPGEAPDVPKILLAGEMTVHKLVRVAT